MPPLPTPAERPDADVVLYDGRCRFCRARAEQLARLDKRSGRLAYLSMHDPGVAEAYPDIRPERLLEEMAVVTPTGERHWGAGAVRYLSRRLPRLWWLAPVMHLPGAMWLARPAYAWVSRNRYLIGGRDGDSGGCDDGACSLPR